MKRLIVLMTVVLAMAASNARADEQPQEESIEALKARIAELEANAAKYDKEAKQKAEFKKKMEEVKAKRAARKAKLEEMQANDPLKKSPELVKSMNLLKKKFPNKLDVKKAPVPGRTK